MSQPSTSDDRTEVAKVPLTKAQKAALYKKTYDEPHDTRRKILKDIHRAADEDGLRQELITSVIFQICEDEGNPLEAILELYAILPDTKAGKTNSLAGMTLQNLKTWLDKQDEPDAIITRCLSQELQAKALAVFSKFHATHLKFASRVYRLHDPKMLPHIEIAIKELNRRQLFKESMDVVTEFNLQEKYGLEEFLIPCILQDQLALVVEYMKGQRHLMVGVLRFLDDFVDHSEDEVLDMLEPYKANKILKVSHERFIGKTVEKTIRALLKDVLEDEWAGLVPRFHKNTRQKQMVHFIKQRYDPDLTPEPDDIYVGKMKELMTNANDSLKQFLVNQLTNKQEYADAARWAIYLKVSNPPRNLRDYMSRHPGINCDSIEKLGLDEGGELFLHPGYPIQFIDNWEGLLVVMGDIEKSTLVGIDSEWKPQTMTTRDEIAILQIAVERAVYLVDFCKLEDVLTCDEWEMFLKVLLFGSPIKLGFDFLNDTRALFSGIKTNKFKYMEEKAENVVCLKRLVDNLLLADDSILDFSRPSTGEQTSSNGIHFKLSDLSEKVCGVKLDKTCQCSNWAQRPLLRVQQMYAAMDAYVVMDIFKRLKDMAISRHIDFDSLLPQSFVNAPKKEKLKKQKQKMEEMEWVALVEQLNDKVVGDNGKPRKAKELKCIVDLMLLGPGKHLRRVGVDVLIPTSKDDFNQMIRHNPDRYILSVGKAYEMLKQQYASRVFCVLNYAQNSPVDVVKCILQKYNVRLDKEQIFSRCMDCNGSCFVRVPSPVLQALHSRHVICLSTFNDEEFDTEHWLEVLKAVRAEDHGGFGCQVDVHPYYDDWVTIFVDGGMIDLTKNIVTHRSYDDGCLTQVVRVPDPVVSRTGCFYYICGACGKVYWDGSHSSNFEKVATELIESTSSSSDTRP